MKMGSWKMNLQHNLKEYRTVLKLINMEINDDKNQ